MKIKKLPMQNRVENTFHRTVPKYKTALHTTTNNTTFDCKTSQSSLKSWFFSEFHEEKYSIFKITISNETVFCLLSWRKIYNFHGFRPYTNRNVPKSLKKLQFWKSFSRKEILIFIDFQKFVFFLKTLKRLVLWH